MLLLLHKADLDTAYTESTDVFAVQHAAKRPELSLSNN